MKCGLVNHSLGNTYKQRDYLTGKCLIYAIYPLMDFEARIIGASVMQFVGVGKIKQYKITKFVVLFLLSTLVQLLVPGFTHINVDHFIH